MSMLNHEQDQVKSYEETRIRGQVKWFKSDKGYGFIESEGIGVDVFVHHSDILAEGFRSLTRGDYVTFELVSGPKGLQAVRVVKGE